MIPFFCDSETYGTIDLTAPSGGLDKYLSTGAESLIWTFARDEQPVQVWDVTSGARMPSEFEDNMLDERVTKVAHNAPFDRNIARVTLGLDTPWDQWHCTMARAYAHALPGSLEALGPVLGLPLDMRKLGRGKELIQMFCKTPKGRTRKTSRTHPADWQEFIDYGLQDTAALREVFKRLPNHNYQGDGYELWVADQEINQRGFYIDQELCRAALKIKHKMEAQLASEIEELTGGAITKGTQRERILHHVVGDYGFLMLDLTKDTIKHVLEEGDIDDQTRRLLELRRDSALSSLIKYQRALERVGPDGRMRYTLQYAGAGRTGRWAGRGFQPHNMPRPKREADEIEGQIIPAILNGTLPQKVDDVNQACQDALRGTIIAAPGHELLVGDWSNIEGVCLAWASGSRDKLAAFRANYEDPDNNPDIYVYLYSRSFGIAPEEVSGKQRQMGKGMELSLGFGGGVGAFTNVAASYGLDLAELGRIVPGIVSATVYNKAEQNWERAFIAGEDLGLEPEVYIACDAMKQVYRQANPEIAQLWWDVERACRNAIQWPGSVHHIARCKIWRTDTYLIIELPSGRRLLYASPRVKKVVEFDEETEELLVRPSIRYMAAKKKQWWPERTYGGKLCLAGATEILTATGWKRLDAYKVGDLLWDGAEWVYGGKLLDQGLQRVIDCAGVAMTPDHEVLTDEGWKTAETLASSKRLNRAEVRLPDCSPLLAQREWEDALGSSLCVRGRVHNCWSRLVKKGSAAHATIVRLQNQTVNRTQQHFSRYEQAPRLRSVAFDERQVQAAHAPSVDQLRRTWDNSVQTLGAQLRELLGRHGCVLRSWLNSGKEKQRRKLQQGELQVGDVQRAGKQQAQLAQVYDIENCGPRHRFTVRGTAGELLIVHNCENITQAIANDILRAALLRVRAEGYPLILHVHDELVAEVPARLFELAPFLQLMEKPLWWADGLPLKAAGYVSTRYKKD